MLNDGPRRKGRFLRRDSKVLEKVALSEFRFGNLDNGKVQTDNAIRTIIHAKYHEAEELDENIVIPPKFYEDLLQPAQQRPIIFPLDFTKDWERANRLNKGRRFRNEDEDFEIESQLGTSTMEEEEEEAAAAAAAAKAHAIAMGMIPPETEAPAPAASAPVAAKPTPAAAPLAPAPDQSRGPLERNRASMDEVGKAIKSLSLSQTAGPEPTGAITPKAVDDFIPNAPPLAGEDPEAAASAAYRQRVAEQQIDSQAVQRAFDEAQARGFQEGFRQGEEKSEIAVRQNAELMFGKVVDLLREFSSLKREVLASAQENFYTLCQAMAEALTRREFSIRPEAFVAVLTKAIDEAVDSDVFKVRVHPTTYAKVEGVAPPDLRSSLVKDSELEPGDFRIESNLGVVDVNLRSMLKELLEQVDIGLYEKAVQEDGKDEVSKTEAKKAG